MKVTISRQTGTHEQVIVELDTQRRPGWQTELEHAFRVADARAWAMMRRTIEGQPKMREIGKQSPELYRAFLDCQEYLYGVGGHPQADPPANVEQLDEPVIANGDPQPE